MSLRLIKPYLIGALLLACLCQPLLAEKEELALLHSFSKAQKGDYIVAHINRNYTLLHINDKTAQTLIIEEITIPASHLTDKVMDWREWIKEGAPHHTSWIMYELEPVSGRVLEFYSFTQHCWMDPAGSDNFLATLLNLHASKVIDHQRKRIGPSPLPGELDRRRLWQPPLVCDGQPIESATFDAWRAMWPHDGTELSGKTLEIYIPSKKGAYPFYFPYWIEIEGTVVKAKLRVKDSGKNLYSPKTALPRRPPTMLDKGLIRDGQLLFRLKTPPYYSDFKLYAVATDNPWKTPIALDFRKEKTDDPQIFKLIVSQDEAAEQLTRGQRYFFQVVPVNNSNLSAETPAALEWMGS